jgi:CRISPR-associated protein Cas5d
MRFSVRAGGEYACFSRPEFKVERVSYLVMTPSAARGVLEAIFWKPEFRWEIRKIHVLNPIRQMALMRNEVDSRQGDRPIVVERQRQLRTSLVLRDVAYVIDAEMVLRPHATDPIAKYSEQFERRLARGQYHHTPYLGTREFAAWVELASGDEARQQMDLLLGTMLFDVAFVPDPSRKEDRLTFVRHSRAGRAVTDGYTQALFFQAELKRGVLTVPREKYAELYSLEHNDA